MLAFSMTMPTDYATNTDRLWIEFPAPWPDAIVSGTLECMSTSAAKVKACIAVNGNAATGTPARIYIGGITVSSASNTLLIRNIVNPPNKDQIVSITVKYYDMANEKLQEITWTNIFTTLEAASISPTALGAPTPADLNYWATSKYTFASTNAAFNIDTTDRYFMNIPTPWTTYLTDNPSDESVFKNALGLKVHGANSPTIVRYNLPYSSGFYYCKPFTKFLIINSN
ncbi:MAG: hypothetical protein QF535_08265 [Anaerolineales bacterium]|nr:hypothetical protein [Anaerolineales bacterium]